MTTARAATAGDGCRWAGDVIALPSMAGSRVLTWNGKDLPEELRGLPAGRYVVESVDDAPALTEEEDEGLRQALDSLRAGRGRSVEQVRQRIDAILRK